MMREQFKDPLFHAGWIEFNEKKWGLCSELLEFSQSGWRLVTIVYRNSKNKIVLPPRNPYLPLILEITDGKSSTTLKKIRKASECLQEYLSKNSLHGGVFFSPQLYDMRPFIWSGLKESIKYTFYIPLESWEEQKSSAVNNKIKKAKNMGYFCEVSDDFDIVQECLRGPEKRKKFDHQISVEDMKLLSELMHESFICFIAKDLKGYSCGAKVNLFMPNGGMALDWSAGIKTSVLKDGVNQLLNAFALDFFAKKGCTIFDHVGANISKVAEAKEAWGGELVAYYGVRQRNARYLAHELLSYFRG